MIRRSSDVDSLASHSDPDDASHNSLLQHTRALNVGKTSDNVLSTNFETKRNDSSFDQPAVKKQSTKRSSSSKQTKELMQMSLQQREDINEEIHGVRSLAIPETAELSTQSLVSMEQAINAQIQQLQQQRQQQAEYSSIGSISSTQLPAYLESQRMRIIHFNQPAFRLKFLRAALFDPSAAAAKLLGFLQLLRDVLGLESLMKFPTFSLNQFAFDDHALLREGRFQLLPGRDRVGRRIVGIFDDFGSSRSIEAKFRVALYVLMAASEDEETQKKGVVIVLFQNDPSTQIFSEATEREMFHRLCDTMPLRVSAVHICLPNDQSEKFQRLKSNAMDSFGNEARKRLRFHYGSPTKLHCELETFGISEHMIPINSNTGRLKTQNFTKWINMRLTREEQMSRAANAAAAASGGRIDVATAEQQYVFPWIECPTQQDVLLGRGRPIMNHKGNVTMRELVGLRLDRFNLTNYKHERIIIVEEVVQAIKSAGGRFLREDHNMNGFWIEVDDKVARQKVGIYFRDLRCSTSGASVAAAAGTNSSSSSINSVSGSSSRGRSPFSEAAQGSSSKQSSSTTTRSVSEGMGSPRLSGRKRGFNSEDDE